MKEDFWGRNLFGELIFLVGSIMIAFAINEFLSVFQFEVVEKVIIFGGTGFLLALSGHRLREKDFVSFLIFFLISCLFVGLLIVIFKSYF